MGSNPKKTKQTLKKKRKEENEQQLPENKKLKIEVENPTQSKQRKKQKKKKKSKTKENDRLNIPHEIFEATVPNTNLSQEKKTISIACQTLDSGLIKEKNDQNLSKKKQKVALDLITCSICLNILSKPHILECGHTFCYECIRTWSNAVYLNGTCPKCRRELKVKPVLDTLVEELVDHLIVDLPEEKTKRILENKESFKNVLDPWKGWFVGGEGEKPLFDVDDGVARCGRCGWEIEDEVCTRCNIYYRGQVPFEEDEIDQGESSDISNYISDDGFVEPDLEDNYADIVDDASRCSQCCWEIQDDDEACTKCGSLGKYPTFSQDDRSTENSSNNLDCGFADSDMDSSYLIEDFGDSIQRTRNRIIESEDD